jgi:iron complex transport system ATP-binding protein
LLQAAEVSFGYGRKAPGALVIDRVSLEIGPGALLGVLGPNGSGKTTLLKLLAGTLRPASGVVRLDGEGLDRLPRRALARRCAVVPQETHLAFEYTALEMVLMGRYPHLGAFEVEGPADLASAMRALEATGTAHLAARGFQTLSGGEKQRVIIASALAQLDDSALHGSTPPGRLLLLDEPTASLDLRYQIEVAQLIRRLHEDANVAIVVSTHDLHFAASVCRDVILLREGRVLAHGPVRDVLTAERVAELYDIDVKHWMPSFGPPPEGGASRTDRCQ